MANILEEIVAAKRQELALQKETVSLRHLQESASSQKRPLNLSGALMEGESALLLRLKRRHLPAVCYVPISTPVRLADIYASNGAAAISVLTDLRFQGEIDHLAQVKQTGASQRAPVLRKDFIFDPYQVYEARAAAPMLFC